MWSPEINPTGSCLSKTVSPRVSRTCDILFSYAQSVTRYSRDIGSYMLVSLREPSQELYGCTLCIHLFNSWCTLTAFLLLCCIWALSLSTASLAGIYQSQLYLTPCTDVSLIVFGSLSLSLSLIRRASGRQPRPSILSCLPLLSISPTPHQHQGHRRSHRSPYFRLPNRGGQRTLGPSPTNSLITAHSPKCVCNVGNHFQ